MSSLKVLDLRHSIQQVLYHFEVVLRIAVRTFSLLFAGSQLEMSTLNVHHSIALGGIGIATAGPFAPERFDAPMSPFMLLKLILLRKSSFTMAALQLLSVCLLVVVVHHSASSANKLTALKQTLEPTTLVASVEVSLQGVMALKGARTFGASKFGNTSVYRLQVTG